MVASRCCHVAQRDQAARISAVVEEALEASFLASITPDVMAHRDELSQIGDEIARIIQEQRGLEGAV